MPQIVLEINFAEEDDRDLILEWVLGALQDCVEVDRPFGLTWEQLKQVEEDFNV